MALQTPFISDITSKLQLWLERRETLASDALIKQTVSVTLRRHGLDPETELNITKRDGRYVYFQLAPAGAGEVIAVGAVD